ncbi:MAG: recombinase family protein [Lachnospiraceae bacterium]|nr:recombinase family protein [Lachnospiraceae bacterium]
MLNPNKIKKSAQKKAVLKPPTVPKACSMDISHSDFGIPVEEMIKRCRASGHTVWAYARVSTKAQNLTRQTDHFLKLGIEKKHIIQDKATGTNFEREGFQKLLGLVQEGDVIIFTELDRFGRDFMENVAFAMRLTIEKRVGIGFIENQSLNRMGEQSPLHALISMIMFLTQAYSSHDEHEKILSRTSQGRKVKAKEGAAFGRKPMDITDKFREMEEGILDGKISHKKARKELGVNYRTLKKWIRYAKKQRMKEAIEGKMGILLKKVKSWCGKVLKTGTEITAESVFEIKTLVEKFITNAGKLADALSVWRRIPVVDEDGAIIRPATYQRKETDLDAEVAELETAIQRINAFADCLISIMEATHMRTGFGGLPDTGGGGFASFSDFASVPCSASEDESGRAEGTDGPGFAAMQDITDAPESRPARRPNVQDALSLLAWIMGKLEKKMAVLTSAASGRTEVMQLASQAG